MKVLSREDRINAVVASYFEVIDRGQACNWHDLVRENADLAEELEEIFREQERIHGLAAPLRQPSKTPSDPTRLAAPSDRTPTFPPSGHDGSVPQFLDDYELLEPIAQGGMGVVYRARQIRLNRIVAIKMILGGGAATSEEKQRFRIEALAAAQLDHPNIVPIYEVGERAGHPYFSMKLVNGASLSESLPRYLGQPRQCATLMAKVARAIHFAHQKGILHRDLKPGNILIDEAGEPYVTDFGLAKRMEADSQLTQTGCVVGTPSYMAPEQAKGDKGLTPTCDVYSLGAILYHLLTGRKVFEGETPMDTLIQVQTQDPVAPRTINGSVNRNLETVCLKCLEKNPGRRYGSAEALAEDLERWRAGESIEARPPSAVQRSVRWLKRRPSVAWGIVFLWLLIIVGIAGWYAISHYLDKAARMQRDIDGWQKSPFYKYLERNK